MTTLEINLRSCTDGYCGALDCVRCRGEDALDFIRAEETDEENDL